MVFTTNALAYFLAFKQRFESIRTWRDQFIPTRVKRQNEAKNPTHALYTNDFRSQRPNIDQLYLVS